MKLPFKWSRPATFEDVFPVWGIEESYEGGLMVLKDGRVALGYELKPIDNEWLSSGEYSQIGELFTLALSQVPAETCIQLLGYYYPIPFSAELQEKSLYEYKILMNYLERPLQQQKLFVFISFGLADIRVKSPVNNLYVRKGKSYTENPFKDIEKTKERLEQIANTFISRVSGHLSFHRLSKSALRQCVLQYFNLEFEMNFQHFTKAYRPHRDCLQVGQSLLGIASMDGQAKEVFYDQKNEQGVYVPTLMPLGYDLEIPHILSVSWKALDTEPAVRALESRAKWTRNLGFLASQAHDTREEEIKEHIHEVTKGGRNLFDMNVSLLFWGFREKEFNQRKDRVYRAFGQMRSSCFMEESDTAALFFANAPGNSYQSYRWLEKLTNENAAVYANYVGGTSSEQQGEVLCDRKGMPLYVDFYSPKLNGNNFLVIGPTGSGKSFTIGYLILQRLERGERQIIIDVGGTYKTIFFGNKKALFYEYDASNPLRYNPFLIHPNPDGTYNILSKANELKPNFLIQLVGMIWLGKENKLQPAEIAVLGELITAYYEDFNQRIVLEKGKENDKRYPCMDGFYQYLVSYRDSSLAQPNTQNYIEYQRRERFFDFNKLIITLKQFAFGGLYGEMLNAEALDQSVSSYPLICFDLAKIKDNATLYPIVGMMIAELATDILAKYPQDIRRIYIDEAWSMLSGLGDFIENMYRTIRKIKGVIGIITQGITELKNAAVGQVVKDNSSTVIILNHSDSKNLQAVAEFMGLTEHQTDLVKSLRKADTWREIFVKQGEFARVYRVEVPLSLQGYLTSTPEDRDFIRGMAGDKGENVHLAINRWVEKKIMNN